MADEDPRPIPIALRLSAEVIARIDRLVEATEQKSPAGAEVTRTSILKSAINLGAAQLERDLQGAPAHGVARPIPKPAKGQPR